MTPYAATTIHHVIQVQQPLSTSEEQKEDGAITEVNEFSWHQLSSDRMYLVEDPMKAPMNPEEVHLFIVEEQRKVQQKLRQQLREDKQKLAEQRAAADKEQRNEKSPKKRGKLRSIFSLRRSKNKIHHLV